MMQVIIAPDKFKGSLTSFQVCKAIRTAFDRAGKKAELFSFPMADGGDGFAAILKHYLHTQTVRCKSIDPIGRPIQVSYEWNEKDKTAIIEMAVASGLVLLQKNERNPLHTSSQGTGILIKDSIQKGAKRIILGLGGSATNDAGMGILAALGFAFEDVQGQQLPPSGENLLQVKKIRIPADIPNVVIQIACDVQNPLYGPSGAAYVYAGQKGATPEHIELLDKGLRNFSDVLFNTTVRSVADIPGTGAAGGIAAGLLSFFNVELIQGIEMIINASQLKKKIQEAGLIITGEGRIDHQSGEGKVVGYMVALARQHNIRCIAVCGQSELDEASEIQLGLNTVIALRDETLSVEYAMSNAESLLIQKLSAYLMNQ